MSLTPTELKAELDNAAGPVAGLNAAWLIGNHTECVRLLNEPGTSGETVRVRAVSDLALQEAVDPAEWASLSTDKQIAWSIILQLGQGQVPITDAIVAQAAQIWAGQPVTIAALNALKTRSASRAEALVEAKLGIGSGDGFRVTIEDVREAREA